MDMIFSTAKGSLPIVALTALFSIVPAFSECSNNAVEAKSSSQAFHMPDTPFLPPYKGHIVSGDVSSKQEANGGIAYNITFETAEQPAQVLEWYKSAFQLYSWNLESQNSAQYRLTAQHGKNVETNIFLLSPRKRGANVQVQLHYCYVGHEI